MRNNNAEYGAFLLRISLGIMFLAHALLKVFVFSLPGTVQFFENAGFPGFLAYVVIFAELAGGIMLLLGFFTRYAAAALLPVLLGATSVHFANGWVFSAPGGGWEYPLFLTIAVIVQGLLGDGALAMKGFRKSV